MMNKLLFRKNKNSLEADNTTSLEKAPSIPNELCSSCPSCKKILFENEAGNYNVCPNCGYHLRLNARKRIDLICDKNTFTEWNSNLTPRNQLNFPGYDAQLNKARLKSRERDAVITGEAKIGGYPCAVFFMNPDFIMGSMGAVVGEKITRLFERAAEMNLPVIGYTVSGGARMQEGMISLMQMAKTSGAVKYHSDKGNLYVTVLTDPTTGGVTASFAMEGDIIIAEPGALIAFAGPRVIEQTIRQKLPEGFQRAEFLLKKGFVDDIVHRKDQKNYLTRLLMLHSKKDAI